MGRIALLKKILPGFIPLFVFIIIDEIWGTRAGLVAALVIGLVEMLWVWIREKRIVKFVLLDTALLVALGSVSLLLDNDIFFKLKPGLIELILCAVLGVSAFSKVNIIGLMALRYMEGVKMNEQSEIQFRKSLKLMFFVFLAHSALVFYSAFFMSSAAWAFISGGLFYLLFAFIFVYEFVRQRLMVRRLSQVSIDENEEWLPLVDEQGAVVGKASRTACHRGERLLHPVVHLHVLNSRNHLYLQKRPMSKLVQPGKWDTAVGGHVAFGENIGSALEREAWEEIGLRGFSARLIKTYRWDSDLESELVYVFVSHNFKSINLHSDEVEEGRFWTPKQIEANIGKGVFTSNFEHEYQLLKKDIVG